MRDVYKMHRIIIIGTGNIGKRHLQAVAKLDIDYDLLCFDIFQPSLDSIATFCKENDLQIKNIDMTTNFSRILDFINERTIIIVATTAKGREDILEKVVARQPLAIISEKPVCQRPKEYEALLQLAKDYSVPVYVNFSRHLSPHYQEIYSEIEGAQRPHISFLFSNVGFGCNGIHFLELATWLFRAETYEIIASEVTSTYASKRKGFSDFSGKLILRMDGGKICTVSISDDTAVDLVEVVLPRKLYTIFETLGKKIVVDQEKKKIDVLEFRYELCSQIMDGVLLDIINGKTPMLPSIQQTHLAHKILFEFMERAGIADLNFT